MLRASRAGNNLRTAAGNHNVLGAQDGLFLNRSRGDRSGWRGGTSRNLNLAIGDLTDRLHGSHNGAGTEGSESE